MKHRNHFHRVAGKFLIPLAIVAGFLSGDCNNAGSDNNSFYYFGNTEVELIISPDTLGILLRDTVLDPNNTTSSYFDKVIAMADSNLQSQGYSSAGNLENDTHIKLVLKKNKKLTKADLVQQLKELKSQQNRIFIANAGYLARIKATNKPLILTDEIIIKFKLGVSKSAINSVFNQYDLNLLRKSKFDSLQYTVAVKKNTPNEILKTAQLLKAHQNVRLVQPNFISAKKYFGTQPTDDLFKEQWSLFNNRPDATEDADIDADLAWDLTMGSANTIIAVIDAGFDINHPDLSPNFLQPDIGWNFDGDNEVLAGDKHGTAVLGLATAASDNVLGIVGSCPGCRSLLIKSGHTSEQDIASFAYASSRGAKVINCSWEQNFFEPMLIDAINNVISDGITVVLAMANVGIDYCSTVVGIRQPSERLVLSDDVIFISRSTSQDSYDNGGWGDCMTVLAPGGVNGSLPGFLKLLTTDILGDAGYNTESGDDCDPGSDNLDYTNCFWGNSAAAPITAGVAGLILSAHPSLTPHVVKSLIQDCADKIENSKAGYLPANGKSNDKKHGYGRLNAYEAVKIASPVDKGGKNGVDIFLRDNELDWGNTEKPSSYLFEPVRQNQGWWRSMDIKVDAKADETPATVNNVFFEGFMDQSPVAEKPNNVFVRVRNRGFNTSGEVTVKLYWVHAGATLPALSSDFWERFPRNATTASEWTLVDTKTIPGVRYSGASNADPVDNTPQIVSFVFNAPFHDPSTVNHYCLMAIISSPDDLMPAAEINMKPDAEKLNMDYITTHYNNATHRNYNIVTEDEAVSTEFNMYNPLPGPLASKLEVSFKGQKIPVHFSDSLEGKLVYLKKNEKKLVRLNIDPGSLKEPTEITIQQLMPAKKKGEFTVIGGISYLIMPTSKKSAASKNKK
jgi:subtilisin family serine protease